MFLTAGAVDRASHSTAGSSPRLPEAHYEPAVGTELCECAFLTNRLYLRLDTRFHGEENTGHESCDFLELCWLAEFEVAAAGLTGRSSHPVGFGTLVILLPVLSDL